LTQLEEDRTNERKNRRIKRKQLQKTAAIISPKCDKSKQTCLKNEEAPEAAHSINASNIVTQTTSAEINKSV
jgi:hypothetical protein